MTKPKPEPAKIGRFIVDQQTDKRRRATSAENQIASGEVVAVPKETSQSAKNGKTATNSSEGDK